MCRLIISASKQHAALISKYKKSPKAVTVPCFHPILSWHWPSFENLFPTEPFEGLDLLQSLNLQSFCKHVQSPVLSTSLDTHTHGLPLVWTPPNHISSTKEEGVAGMTARGLRCSSALQHRLIRHIAVCVLRMMSAGPSQCLCCVSSFPFLYVLFAVYIPLQRNPMKCHDFPNASYLTTFVCCRVNTVVHVIEAVFDSAPLFTACLNISNQPRREGKCCQ